MSQAKQHTFVWGKGWHLLSPSFRPELLGLNKVCAAEVHGVGGQLDRSALGYSVPPNYHVSICDPEVNSYLLRPVQAYVSVFSVLHGNVFLVYTVA